MGGAILLGDWMEHELVIRDVTRCLGSKLSWSQETYICPNGA